MTAAAALVAALRGAAATPAAAAAAPLDEADVRRLMAAVTDEGGRVAAVTDERGASVVQVALEAGVAADVLRALLDEWQREGRPGADGEGTVVWPRDVPDGGTLLHTAVRCGSPAGVAAVVAAGAAAGDEVDRRGGTAFHVAAEGARNDAACAVMATLAAVLPVAVSAACLRHADSLGRLPLHVAAARGPLIALEWLARASRDAWGGGDVAASASVQTVSPLHHRDVFGATPAAAIVAQWRPAGRRSAASVTSVGAAPPLARVRALLRGWRVAAVAPTDDAGDSTFAALAGDAASIAWRRATSMSALASPLAPAAAVPEARLATAGAAAAVVGAADAAASVPLPAWARLALLHVWLELRVLQLQLQSRTSSQAWLWRAVAACGAIVCHAADSGPSYLWPAFSLLVSGMALVIVFPALAAVAAAAGSAWSALAVECLREALVVSVAVAWYGYALCRLAPPAVVTPAWQRRDGSSDPPPSARAFHRHGGGGYGGSSACGPTLCAPALSAGASPAAAAPSSLDADDGLCHRAYQQAVALGVPPGDLHNSLCINCEIARPARTKHCAACGMGALMDGAAGWQRELQTRMRCGGGAIAVAHLHLRA